MLGVASVNSPRGSERMRVSAIEVYEREVCCSEPTAGSN
jgi:hypothetical protein